MASMVRGNRKVHTLVAALGQQSVYDVISFEPPHPPCSPHVLVYQCHVDSVQWSGHISNAAQGLAIGSGLAATHLRSGFRLTDKQTPTDKHLPRGTAGFSVQTCRRDAAPCLAMQFSGTDLSVLPAAHASVLQMQ